MTRGPAILQFWLYIALLGAAALIVCGCDQAAPAKPWSFAIPPPVCPVPLKGPNVFINYYYANSCTHCIAAGETTASLVRQGYTVIYRDTDSASGKVAARAYGVTSVPTWLVDVDGRQTLKTSDSRELLQHLQTVR